MGRDKRREPRFVVEGLQGHMTFASEVEILNMSLSGVALRTDRRLVIGNEYQLRLEADGGHGLNLKGVVVWCALEARRKDDEATVSGRTLLDMAADDYGDARTREEARRLMRALIAARLGGQSLHTRAVLAELQDL